MWRQDPRRSQLHVELASSDGAIVQRRGGVVTLRRVQVGDLVVSSGRVVAGDPAAIGGEAPIAAGVPPHRYPVALSVAHLPGGDQRVAFATIQLGSGTTARWASLGRAFSVDSAVACFVDAELAHAMGRPEQIDAWVEAIAEAMAEATVPTWSWANVSPDSDTHANVIAFSAGMGDGAYATYAGEAADGTRLCLAIDFAVV